MEKDQIEENITYYDSKYDALDDDALLLITEGKEFRNPDFDEMNKRLGKSIIFDSRIFSMLHLKKKDLNYIK